MPLRGLRTLGPAVLLMLAGAAAEASVLPVSERGAGQGVRWAQRAWERPALMQGAPAPMGWRSRGWGLGGPAASGGAGDGPVLSRWALPVSGNWMDAGFWDTPAAPNNGTPPGTVYDAVIDALGPAYTVTLNSSVGLNSLRLDANSATLRHTGGVLEVGQFDLVSGQYRMESGTLQGGTLNMLGGSLWLQNSILNRMIGMTINGDVAATGGTRILDGLTLNGEWRLTGSNGFLAFEGDQTLHSGDIVFEGTNGGERRLNLQNGSMVTLAPGTSVRGGYAVIGETLVSGGSGPRGLINHGLISADMPGRDITAVAQAEVRNHGTIEAINGGRLTINNFQGDVNTARADGAGSVLTLDGVYTNNLSLPVTGGATLTLRGDWTNTGSIDLSGGSILNLGGQFQAAALGTINRGDGTIRLTGEFDNVGSVFTLNQATGPWQLAGGTVLGGMLNLDGVTMDTFGTAPGMLDGVSVNGVLRVLDGGHLRLRGEWQHNGEIQVANSTLDLGGSFSSGAIGSIVRTPASGGLVVISGEVDNTGNVLNLDNTTGQIRLRGTIEGGTVNTAGSNLLLIDGPSVMRDVTFSGEATVGGSLTGDSLNNAGSIRINQNRTLTMTGDWTNTGVIELNNGRARLEGEFTTAEMGSITTVAGNHGDLVIPGTLDNTGAAVTIGAQFPTLFLEGATLIGGTVSGTHYAYGVYIDTPGSSPSSTSRFQSVTVNSPVAIDSATTLEVSNDSVLTGRVALQTESTLALEGDHTFGGNFHGSPAQGYSNRITVEPGKTLTLSPSALVNGMGIRVGERSGPGDPNALINMGTVRAEHSSYLPIVLAADATTNLGVLEARNGGSIWVDHLIGNVGTASVQDPGSVLRLDGDYTNNLSLPVTNGGTLDLRGNWTNSGTINVDGGNLRLGGTFTQSNIGNLVRNGGTVQLAGTLDNTGSNLTLNSTTGSWDLAGGTILGGTVDLVDGVKLRTMEGTSSRLSGATVNGPLDLPTGELRMDSGASLTGNMLLTRGVVTYEGDSTISAGTYTFNGTGFGFGMIRAVGAGGTKDPVILTIGPGATIKGGNAHLGSVATSSQHDTIINQGLISADVPGLEILVRSDEFHNEGVLEAKNGGIIALGQPGSTFSWSNTGLIRLIDSTLKLGGTFNVGALGNFEQTNSSVDITGVLENQGNVLSLSPATGSWNLVSTNNQPSPRIVGGTVETSGGVRLGVRGTGTAILDGVMLNAGLDVQGMLRLENGTTVPRDVHFHGGHLVLNDGVVLDDAEYVFNGVRVTGSNHVPSRVRTDPVGTGGTLTIGANTTLRGHGGRLGNHELNGAFEDTIVNRGLISADVTPDPSNSFGIDMQPRIFVNEGTVEARNGGRLELHKPYFNASFEPPMAWSNTGLIRALDGTINLGGRIATADLGLIERDQQGAVVFNGELENTGSSLVINAQRNVSRFAGRLIGGTLVGPSSATLPVSGELVDVEELTGTFTLGGTVLGGLHLNGSATIPGTWTVRGDQTISGGEYILGGGQFRTWRNETLTLAPDAIIRGSGTLANRDSTSHGPNTLINLGKITADVPNQNLTISANSFTNHGLLEAVNEGRVAFSGPTNWVHRGQLRVADDGLALLGGTFSVVGGALINDGGTIRITGTLNNQNSILTLGGTMGDIELSGTIAGGTVESTGNGRLLVPDGAGGGRLDGVTLNSDLHATRGMWIRNHLWGSGTLSTGGSSALAITIEGENNTFHGGNLVLEGPSASAPHRLQFLLPPSSLTLGSAASIRGGNAIVLDHLGVGGSLTNHGVISADLDGAMLTIAADDFVNHGTVEAINGGILNIAGPATGLQGPDHARNWSGPGTVRVIDSTLRLGGTFPTSALDNFERSGGVVELYGTIDNRNSTLTLDGPGESWFAMGGRRYNKEWIGARIQGGTVNLLNNAALHLPALGGVVLDGTAFNGGLNVEGDLWASPGTTVSGPITIQQGAVMYLYGEEYEDQVTLPTNELVFAGTVAPSPRLEGHNVLIPSTAVVRGGHGFLQATGSNGILRNYGRVSADTSGKYLGLTGTSWINHGVVEAVDGGYLDLNGTYSSPGIVRLTEGLVTVRGKFSTEGFGGFDRSGGTVRFGASINNTGSSLDLDGFDWIMDGTYLKGGQLNLINSASVLIEGQPTTFDGVDVNGRINLVQEAAQLHIRGGLDLTGDLHLAGPGTRLHFFGNESTISGGTVLFDHTPGGDDRLITGLGNSILTLAPAATVRGGRGTLQTNSGSTIINRGLISADVNDESITIYTARFQNEGTVEAINGGSIVLVPPESGPPMDLINAGVLRPGPQTLILPGAFTQTEAGTLLASVGLLDGMLVHTRLIAEDDFALDGRLRVGLAGGLEPWPGLSFTLLDIDFGRLSGGFAQVELPTLSAGYSWDLSALYTTGRIAVVPSPGAAALMVAGLFFVAPRRRRAEASR